MSCQDSANYNILVSLIFCFIFSKGAVERCQQLETMRLCKCWQPYLSLTPEIIAILNDEQMGSCLALAGFHNESMVESVDETLEKIQCFTSISYGDKCNGFKNPCKENVYDFSQIQTAWPHESYELALYTTMIRDVEESRREKCGNKFDVYEDILAMSNVNRSLATEMLRDVNLIERNFIQIKVEFPVGCRQHYSTTILDISFEVQN